MKKKNKLLLTAKILGILSSVLYFSVVVLIILSSYVLTTLPITFKSEIIVNGLVFTFSELVVFVISVLGTVWVHKAIKYCSRDYCTKATLAFITVSCITLNPFTVLSAVFCFRERNTLIEGTDNIKRTMFLLVVLYILSLPITLVCYSILFRLLGIA